MGMIFQKFRSAHSSLLFKCCLRPYS